MKCIFYSPFYAVKSGLIIADYSLNKIESHVITSNTINNF